MALVSFWVISWQAYWLLSSQFYITVFSLFPIPHPQWECLPVLMVAFAGALVPTVFFSLSIGNSPFRVRDLRVVISFLCFAAAIAAVNLVGDYDFNLTDASIPAAVMDRTPEPERWNLVVSKLQPSWLLLLAPTAAATGVVAFFAYRRVVPPENPVRCARKPVRPAGRP